MVHGKLLSVSEGFVVLLGERLAIEWIDGAFLGLDGLRGRRSTGDEAGQRVRQGGTGVGADGALGQRKMRQGEFSLGSDVSDLCLALAGSSRDRWSIEAEKLLQRVGPCSFCGKNVLDVE